MDERIRELERRADQGDVAAATELLQHRLRTGESSEQAVLILARLGDPAATALFPDHERETLHETYPELVALDPVFALRALCTAIAVGLPLLERWVPEVPGVVHALHSTERWLARRDEESLLLARDSVAAAREAVNQINSQLLGRYRIAQISGSQMRALEYVAWTSRDAAEGVVHASVGAAPAGDSLIRLVGLWKEAGWGDLRQTLRSALEPTLRAS
ncbi:MAG: hypothetical protein JKY65_01855 [Planctomycetes bacterium]|nr:hypothetical protein [Planctomycetota bacterium]